MRRIVVAVVGLAALVLTACASVAQPAGAPSATPTAPHDQFTPLIARTLSQPHWFTGSDGKTHLVWELLLLSDFPVPVTVTGLDVLDADRGTTVTSLSGTALKATVFPMVPLGSPPSTTVPPSTQYVAMLDVPLAGPRSVPAHIIHRLTLDAPRIPGVQLPSPIVYRSAYATVDRRPPVVLSPPLAGPGWITFGSCCTSGHRSAIQPVNGHLRLAQRFAIDFNGSDPQHRLVVGDPGTNTGWVFFGAPVLAVANAKVVIAHDGEKDQTPNQPDPVSIDQADGNYVVLDLGHNRFAFYAHLENGSVAVKPGQRVCAGQQIGKLGNSGSSSGPHLHFHVSDGVSAIDADGLPYVFSNWRLTGTVPTPTGTIIKDAEAGNPYPFLTTSNIPERDTYPLPDQVMSFAAQSGCR